VLSATIESKDKCEKLKLKMQTNLNFCSCVSYTSDALVMPLWLSLPILVCENSRQYGKMISWASLSLAQTYVDSSVPQEKNIPYVCYGKENAHNCKIPQPLWFHFVILHQHHQNVSSYSNFLFKCTIMIRKYSSVTERSWLRCTILNSLLKFLVVFWHICPKLAHIISHLKSMYIYLFI